MSPSQKHENYAFPVLCQRVCTTQPLGGQNRFLGNKAPNEPGVSEGECTLLFLVSPEKAAWMGEGKNGKVMPALLETS